MKGRVDLEATQWFQHRTRELGIQRLLKTYFQSKIEQAVQGLQAFAFCVLNVNSTVVDLKDHIILKILKEKLVISCLLGSFYLKIV